MGKAEEGEGDNRKANGREGLTEREKRGRTAKKKGKAILGG